VYLFGIQNKAVSEQINYVVDKDVIIGKGPNGTLSMIIDYHWSHSIQGNNSYIVKRSRKFLIIRVSIVLSHRAAHLLQNQP